MTFRTIGLAAALLAGPALPGCTGDREARYVYRDGQYGVIGLSRNTTTTRRSAEKMMAHHFPDGYEIVREEEIETGARTANRDRSQSSGIKPGAGMAHLLIGLGESSRSTAEKLQDQVKIHESRIIYKKRTEDPTVGYTILSSISPEMYVDPIASIRHPDAPRPELAAKPKADDDVKQAKDEP